MRFIDEYRNEDEAYQLVKALYQRVTRPWNIMEICGGQTHTLIKSGIDQMAPSNLRLIHGPGCPVCVTPLELIDKAIHIAQQPHVVFMSFGDMLRVPGSSSDLLSVKAHGGDVRMVYSPLDAVNFAFKHPDCHVVFFAVGFETTAPATAMAIWQANRQQLTNFSILCSHVLVPPAMETLLGSPESNVHGFLAAGHVCTVMGYWQYESIAETYRIPIVVTGFEPLDLLQGIYMVIESLEEGRYGVENQYRRAVKREGNVAAQHMMQRMFDVTDRQWRGIGIIPNSGYRLKPAFAQFDAEQRFDVAGLTVQESTLCMAGKILQGLIRPDACPAFGKECTPEHPLGAPMVSSEGACAAYYQYGNSLNLNGREENVPG